MQITKISGWWWAIKRRTELYVSEATVLIKEHRKRRGVFTLPVGLFLIEEVQIDARVPTLQQILFQVFSIYNYI